MKQHGDKLKYESPQYVRGSEIEKAYGIDLSQCPFCDTKHKPHAVIQEDEEDPDRNIVTFGCDYCGAEAGWTGWGTVESGYETKEVAILEAARCWNRRRGDNDDLKDAVPARYPGRAYRRHGTNFGIKNAAGAWIFIGENIAGFNTRYQTKEWIANPNRCDGQHRNWRVLPADIQF